MRHSVQDVISFSVYKNVKYNVMEVGAVLCGAYAKHTEHV